MGSEMCIRDSRIVGRSGPRPLSGLTVGQSFSERAQRGAKLFRAGPAWGKVFLFFFVGCNMASSMFFETLKNFFFSEPFYRRWNKFYFHRLTKSEWLCRMDNILSIGGTMTQLTTQQHQRYHVKLEGRRTTISLDFCLAGLLAARLGVAPNDKKANVTVREWLQARTKEDVGGTGLNRRLMRQATIAIADNELSRRCAVWLGVDVGGSATKQIPPRKVDEKHAKGNFVLYRFNYNGNRRSTPPDIIALGDTIEKVKMIIEQTYSEGDRRTAMLAAEVAPKEKERDGGYYIRRCSEKCWEKLKNKEEHALAIDPAGTWVTREEMARIRQAIQFGNLAKPMAGKPRRSVSDDEKPTSS